ncbi:DgyrCDS5593 [Dimorphilus gyrociliatus]|uniref:DgyrCDS5593 n=1 Tax=Dimorphilus gyrociliatus TaxID=2664684 RepID=A0A7I8VKC8_9ANNE|nr:DgyrCDS5593 [Dimorphilus gyrociliatus]
MAENEVDITIKWSGKEYPFKLPAEKTVLNLKECVETETKVLVCRQKLFGLKTKVGKPALDNSMLSDLNIKPGQKFMMMGSKEEVLEEASKKPENQPEVVDEFDIEEDEIPVEAQEIYLEKVQKRVNSYKIDIINEPRKGKKLLVLDIDYTLFG